MTTMTTHDIETVLRKLRLSGMAETLQTRLMQAHAAQEPFLGYRCRPCCKTSSTDATVA